MKRKANGKFKGRKVIKITKFLKKTNNKGIKKIFEEMSKRLKETEKVRGKIKILEEKRS
jgi:hypothetical protein